MKTRIDMQMRCGCHCQAESGTQADRKSTRLNSSHLVISYAVFCLKKKKTLRSAQRHERAPGREARSTPCAAPGLVRDLLHLAPDPYVDLGCVSPLMGRHSHVHDAC